MARMFGYLFALVVALTLAIAAWRSLESSRRAEQVGSSAVPHQAPRSGGPRAFGMRADAECRGPAAFEGPTHSNAASVTTLTWAPFGRTEIGWQTYWPLIANEIGSDCGPASGAFAERLAGWQRRNGLVPDGVLKPEEFDRMRITWLRRLPNVAGRGGSVCAAPPPQSGLALADDSESYGGKTIYLHPQSLSAYRRMVEAARAEVPALKHSPQMLVIFSGFRDPAADEARCASDGDCDGVVRSTCSPHRTGLALDLVLGNAPGQRIDSTDDANRLRMSQTPAYRWMVANADRFGFVNYPFEPWHWEWTGLEPAERNAASALSTGKGSPN